MKILWACEPFHQDAKQTGGFFRLMSEIAGSEDSVEACFIVTRSENELNLAFDVPIEERFTTFPRQKLSQLFKKSQVPIPDSRIHIDDYPTLSTTKTADRLIALAGKRKADLVALFTHSRKGYERFMMGSFAETVIHRSKSDLLIATPKTKFPSRIRRVLFASDFTNESKKHLTAALGLCKQLGAKLVVFHAAFMFYDESYDEESAAVTKYRKEVNQYRDWIESQAAKAGVQTEIQISSELSFAHETTLKIASKQKADLIVVAAKAGPATVLMGGSFTRKIVRSSQTPVLILR